LPFQEIASSAGRLNDAVHILEEPFCNAFKTKKTIIVLPFALRTTKPLP